MTYPAVLDPSLVGTYDAVAKAGGGYVWDEVLEYRVWCHPDRGAADEADGNDYYYVFVTYEEALDFSRSHEGTEEPLALVLQREYIDEPSPGEYLHVRQERIPEWPVTFLSRPRRTERTIPDFMDPNAPPNRLAILRGQESRPAGVGHEVKKEEERESKR
jgi:putative acetyltransferase